MKHHPKVDIIEGLATISVQVSVHDLSQFEFWPEYDLFYDGLPIYESETNAHITAFYQRNGVNL